MKFQLKNPRRQNFKISFRNKGELPLNIEHALKTVGVGWYDYCRSRPRGLWKMQKGDVFMTKANTERLKKIAGFKPNTPITVGINRFVKWYKEYYKI